jgi:hypothetical protein
MYLCRPLGSSVPRSPNESSLFVFEYLGYTTKTSGQTTIAFRVTNKCKNAISYAAIGTGSLTRIAPADKSIYTGNLGTYTVSWTRNSGNPSFVAVKFEPTLKNFNNGASEVFSVVVSNFNPNTTIQVEASAGSHTGTFSFVLGQTNCAVATLSPQPTEDLFDWRGRELVSEGVEI